MTATVASLLCLAGTGCRPCGPERFDAAGLNRAISVNDLTQAEIVVVARVAGFRGVGAPRPSTALPRMLIECAEITGDVENVLKGDYTGRTIRFFYYLYSSRNRVDLGPPRYVPAEGQRRVFFLVREGSSLRSVGDVRDYTLKVSSGFHRSSSLDGLSFGQRLASVLLTPGEGYHSRDFAISLGQAEYVSDRVAGSRYTDELLERLESGADPSLSQEARGLMADRTYWRKRRPGQRE